MREADWGGFTPDEGDVLDGAAGLGEARTRQLLCARQIVGPTSARQGVKVGGAPGGVQLFRMRISYQFSTGQTWWFITAMAYLQDRKRITQQL